MKALRFALLLALVVWSFGGARVEARSGGSGGGFSRSSGSSHSSSRSSGSSRSSSSSSRSRSSGGSYYGGGSGSLSPGFTALIALVFIAFMIAAMIKRMRQAKAQKLSVGRVQLGFDALQTKGLRAAIEAAVRDSDPTSALGIWRMSQRVLDKIAPHVDHVSFAGFLEKNDLHPDIGERLFQTLAQAARAFFDREIIRKDAQGTIETERNSKKANELTDEDGDFGIDELFVVTLVMAVKQGPLGLPATLGTQADISSAVQTMHTMSQERCVGFEVIWTPAAESDILGRAELLVAFPEMAPL